MHINNTFLLRVLLILIAISSISIDVISQSAIYVGGHFRRNRPTTITNLKASGFTCVILFNVEVRPTGDLLTDGDTICTKGVYVFGKKHPYYVSDVESLKTGNTSIYRVETCIGGWGSTSYDNIKTLINANGTGENTMLYKNFKALKEAIPSIEAVNNDDEKTYDVNIAVKFSIMLANIGYKTTLAPYMNPTFWKNTATQINTQRPGTVDIIYLQCYDGGQYNNPCDWNFGSIPVHYGLGGAGSATITSVADTKTKMQNEKSSCNVKGGFIWVYNAEDIDMKGYALSINTVFPSYAKASCNILQ